MAASIGVSGGHGVHLAYLASQYPATSHTFIRREIAELRELGLQIDAFSIRHPSSSELDDDRVRDEARNTFTVLRQPATSFMTAHLGTVATRPLAYFNTLQLALRHRPPGLRGFVLALAHFAESIVLARELRRRGVTRLHNHFANSAATVGYLATTLLRLPWSFTIHGISETDYPAGLLLGRKIEAANFVVCVSYFGRAQAMRLVAPVHWSKLHVVRCGLQLDAMPMHAKPSSGLKRAICVGRLSAEKGQSGLLEAIASLCRTQTELELVFIGEGPESDRLRASAARLGIADRVKFSGRCGEQETLTQIAAADILVLPSLMEGLPIVLMEAMATGTAVIASRVAGIPELIEDGKSGLLFTPSNWDELALCMRRLISDDALRETLSRGGRAAVETEFDIRFSALKLRELFALDNGS